MSRPLRFSRAEIANAAKIAVEHGVAVRLERSGSIIVLPAPPMTVDKDDEDDLDAELAAFEAEHGRD